MYNLFRHQLAGISPSNFFTFRMKTTLAIERWQWQTYSFFEWGWFAHFWTKYPDCSGSTSLGSPLNVRANWDTLASYYRYFPRKHLAMMKRWRVRVKQIKFTFIDQMSSPETIAVELFTYKDCSISLTLSLHNVPL